MRLKLKSLEYWGVVDPDTTSTAAELRDCDAKAQQEIMKHVADELVTEVTTSATARAAWRQLETVAVR